MERGFPSQCAPMSFERERYPNFLESDTIDEVLAEQERVLRQAVPIRSMKIVRGDLLNMGNDFSPLGATMAEILVDVSDNPELAAMLDRVRASARPLPIAVFSQWTISRSERHWLALLYLNFELGPDVAKFHLAFEMRDAKQRAMLSQIEQSGRLLIDDAASDPIVQMRVVAPTDLISMPRGQMVERMRGLSIEVISSIVNAFSYADIFKLAVLHTTSLEAAWPRLLFLDRQMTAVTGGADFSAPPLDEHAALTATRHIELYISFCSWYGNPIAIGFGNVQLIIDRGISAVAAARRPGWQQLALRGENLTWIAPFAVPAWEIVLAWKTSSGDPWPRFLEALDAKFDSIPVDRMPMMYFIIQVARTNNLELADAWVDAVRQYEIGLMPLVPAVVEAWASADPQRRHHPALSTMQLNPELQAKVTFLHTLLPILGETYSWIHATPLEHMDKMVLLTIDAMARRIWTLDMRGIIRALLDTDAPDMQALTGIGLLDSLIVASAWQPNPPNPLLQQRIPPQLLPFLYFQHQLIRCDLAPLDAGDVRYLTHDLTEQFGPATFARRMLPWNGMQRDTLPDAEREEQITAAVYWLLDQVTRAQAKGSARPAVGRFEIEVPPGFTDLAHFGVERLRILALDGLLLVRLVLAPGMGGIILPWVPLSSVPASWRMLVPEAVIWSLTLALAAVYRDIVCEGKEQVLYPTAHVQHPHGSHTRGRSSNLALPRPSARVRLGGALAQPAKATRHEWSTAEEREYIQKRKHGVKGKVVRLPAHYHASQEQRDLVERLGLPELPETGLTYRRGHTRGTDTPETVAKPIRAKGLLLALGVLDSINHSRKDTTG